ncbi:MAG TPA: SDR family oxidoreductase [bacterium]|nr:SDR family oxidoreductase [bacterium]
MARFANKIVFLTGASSGIGEAMARVFAQEGADLILFARRRERLEKLAGELEGQGRRALVCVGDVTQDGELEAAVARGVEAFGRIDVAVANAGFGIYGKVEKLTLEEYRRQFETNVFGVLRTVWATLPELKKTGGRLVLIGSVNSYISLPDVSGYAMSKFAVKALADALYLELGPAGVSVTLICPGFVTSEIRLVDNRGVYREEKRDSIPSWIQMPAEKAARQIVKAVASRRREKIITFHGKFFVFLNRLIPGLMLGFARRFTRELRRDW